jgi:ABC-type sugar transport system permease subunit
MKKAILRYGLYGAASICILFLLSWLIGDNLSYSVQEIIGYASIVISLSFVFFGIRHFKDKINDGTVSFGKALLLGLAISLITALAFGVLDVVYIKYINPDFTEEYYARSLERLEETLPAAEFESERVKMESEKQLFMNPVISFIVMSMTVLIIGFIISLLSAMVLQRKKIIT